MELFQSNTSDAGLANFKDCRNLVRLDVSNTKVSNSGLAQVAGYSRLAMANLKDTRVSPAGALELSAALPKCKIIWQNGVIDPAEKPDPDGSAAEYVLAVGGEIVIRESRGTKWSQTLVWSAKHLPASSFEIRLVDLSQNQQVRDVGLALFKDCKNLQALALDGTKVNDAGLAAFKNCSILNSLELEGTEVGDEGLAHFTDHRSLTVLGLTGTNVTDAGLAYLKDCHDFSESLMEF